MEKKNKLLAIFVLVASILIGGVAWGLIYSFGWFVGIIAFATAYLAVMAYDKFCPVSNMVYIITAVAIIVCNVVASFISLGITVAIESEVTFGFALNWLLNNFDLIAKEFAIDMVLCIVLTCLGIYGFKKSYEQKKARAIGKTNLDSGMVENETLKQSQLKDLKEKIAEIEKENNNTKTESDKENNNKNNNKDENK